MLSETDNFHYDWGHEEDAFIILHKGIKREVFEVTREGKIFLTDYFQDFDTVNRLTRESEIILHTYRDDPSSGLLIDKTNLELVRNRMEELIKERIQITKFHFNNHYRNATDNIYTDMEEIFYRTKGADESISLKPKNDNWTLSRLTQKLNRLFTGTGFFLDKSLSKGRRQIIRYNGLGCIPTVLTFKMSLAESKILFSYPVRDPFQQFEIKCCELTFYLKGVIRLSDFLRGMKKTIDVSSKQELGKYRDGISMLETVLNDLN
jgi:hypothetical protein